MSNFDYLSNMLARVQGVSIMYLFCSHRRQTSVGQVAVSELRFSFSNNGHEKKSIRGPRASEVFWIQTSHRASYVRNKDFGLLS